MPKFRKTKREYFEAAVSRSEQRRILLQVPDDESMYECPFCHGRSSTCEDCMGSGYIKK